MLTAQNRNHRTNRSVRRDIAGDRREPLETNWKKRIWKTKTTNTSHTWRMLNFSEHGEIHDATQSLLKNKCVMASSVASLSILVVLKQLIFYGWCVREVLMQLICEHLASCLHLAWSSPTFLSWLSNSRQLVCDNHQWPSHPGGPNMGQWPQLISWQLYNQEQDIVFSS